MFISKDNTNYITVFIISCIVVLDLFLHAGQPITFDGPTHITAIAQFQLALKDGDFPVVWTDRYANYGLPIAIVAHQLPNYIGAIMSFFIHNYLLVNNLLLFGATLLSGIFFYKFLRLYFEPAIALLGTTIFTFAPYKIINIYIRGAMPEYFSAIFLPFILLGLHSFVKTRSISAAVTVIVSLTLLALTHPFLFVIYLFAILPYFIFLLIEQYKIENKKKILEFFDLKLIVGFGVMVGISLLLASFYLIPLLVETKYLVYSKETSKSTLQFLDWKNFLNPSWYYYYQTDIFTRGHLIKTGVVEFLSLFAGVGVVGYKWFVKKERIVSILEYAVVSGLIMLFFMTKYSVFFHKNVFVLSAIQFPWRILSAFIFIPPIIIAYLCRNIKNNLVILILIVTFSLQYMPQLYGKNYTEYGNDHYTFTPINLFGAEKNTLWTGKTEDYPIKKQKYDIIGGQGVVTKAEVHNSSRTYQVSAQTPIRMVDYTFYFPGWKVYVDSKPTNIEFQDPNYRGVITYTVPQGNHTIYLKFEDTKIRFTAKLMTVFSIILLPFVLYLVKKLKLLDKKSRLKLS